MAVNGRLTILERGDPQLASKTHRTYCLPLKASRILSLTYEFTIYQKLLWDNLKNFLKHFPLSLIQFPDFTDKGIWKMVSIIFFKFPKIFLSFPVKHIMYRIYHELTWSNDYMDPFLRQLALLGSELTIWVICTSQDSFSKKVCRCFFLAYLLPLLLQQLTL